MGYLFYYVRKKTISAKVIVIVLPMVLAFNALLLLYTTLDIKYMKVPVQKAH